MESSLKSITIDAASPDERYWKDIWDFRELIYFLSWRSLLVRYKQTAVGILWAVLRPLLIMIALTFVFGRLANLAATEAVPYTLVVLSALLPWQFFANALAETSESLVGNTNLVSKVYFPRLIIPMSTTIVSLVDFFITLTLLGCVLLFYQFAPSWPILFLPLFTLWAALLTFGVGTWVAAFNVKYRDFRYLIPFVIQFGLYITPVGFPSTVVPLKWRWLYELNPLVGIIDGFRWAILGHSQSLSFSALASSCIVTLVILFFSLRYFRRMEKSFADLI